MEAKKLLNANATDKDKFFSEPGFASGAAPAVDRLKRSRFSKLPNERKKKSAPESASAKHSKIPIPKNTAGAQSPQTPSKTQAKKKTGSQQKEDPPNTSNSKKGILYVVGSEDPSHLRDQRILIYTTIPAGTDKMKKFVGQADLCQAKEAAAWSTPFISKQFMPHLQECLKCSTLHDMKTLEYCVHLHDRQEGWTGADALRTPWDQRIPTAYGIRGSSSARLQWQVAKMTRPFARKRTCARLKRAQRCSALTCSRHGTGSHRS